MPVPRAELVRTGQSTGLGVDAPHPAVRRTDENIVRATDVYLRFLFLESPEIVVLPSQHKTIGTIFPAPANNGEEGDDQQLLHFSTILPDQTTAPAAAGRKAPP
ncbi:hypothetical protein GCM10029964_108160 [Kibdelosporangium lantanae]